MSKILYILVAGFILMSCSDSPQKESVSKQADYEIFLKNTTVDLEPLNNKVSLWTSKIQKEPKGFIFYEKLGSTYNDLFEKTGEISYLSKADSLFAVSQKLTRGKWKVPSLLSLSSLAVKKHDFRKAAVYAVSARELTDEKFGPLLMQFDAEMELGNYEMAGGILAKNKRMESFDYLVRLSKYKDYEGDLDSAIYYMEKASDLVLSYQKERKLWATANLADMYGHAGRIKDSYVNYLKVLSMDSTYDYALKGIAWVAYSNDGKTREAKKILQKLQAKTAMPNYYLLLADISEFEGNEIGAKSYTYQFLVEASKPKYEGMYSKYLIDVLIEQEKFEQALKLANQEVEKRPTPAAYDWLAWTLFKQGKTEDAIQLYRENVEGKTYEPDVIYHMGVVYHQAGEAGGKEYLKESLEASYELGPLVAMEIKSILKG